MPAAIRSVFTAGVALAGAGVIAVSPVAPTPDVHLPTVQSPAIELLAAPAFGANLYQVMINQLGNFLASTPIVIGSTQQCTVCLGPAPGVNSIPYTGWGAIGITVGLFNSLPAFFTALTTGSTLIQSLGQAGMAVQTPITNTFSLIQAEREPYGGYQLQDTLTRTLGAVKLVLNSIYDTGVQALITGPLGIATGVIVGLQTFAQVLATSGSFTTALSDAAVPIIGSIDTARTDLVTLVGDNRTDLYNLLGSGPQAATSPIPTLDSDAPAAPSAALKAAAAVAAADDSDDSSSTAGSSKDDADSADAGSGSGRSSESTVKSGDSHAAKHGVGGSKRQRSAD